MREKWDQAKIRYLKNSSKRGSGISRIGFLVAWKISREKSDLYHNDGSRKTVWLFSRRFDSGDSNIPPKSKQRPYGHSNRYVYWNENPQNVGFSFIAGYGEKQTANILLPPMRQKSCLVGWVCYLSCYDDILIWCWSNNDLLRAVTWRLPCMQFAEARTDVSRAYLPSPFCQMQLPLPFHQQSGYCQLLATPWISRFCYCSCSSPKCCLFRTETSYPRYILSLLSTMLE